MQRLLVVPVLAVLFGVAALFGTGRPALAQAPGAALPPFEILTIIRSLDFEPLEEPQRRGGVYRLRALDFDGEEVRLVVDARRGRVISATPVFASAPPPPPPRGYVVVPGPGYLPPYGYRNPHIIHVPEAEEYFDEPRVIYGPRTNAAPSRPAVRAPAQKSATRPAATARAPAPASDAPLPAPSSQLDTPPPAAAPPVQPLDNPALPKVDAPPAQGFE